MMANIFFSARTAAYMDLLMVVKAGKESNFNNNAASGYGVGAPHMLWLPSVMA
jgi:hypothetical protein